MLWPITPASPNRAMQLDTWVAMHEDLRDSPRCALTFAALAEGLAPYIRDAAAR